MKEVAQITRQAWQPVARTFRDGHRERWWALEIQAGPYGPRKLERAACTRVHKVHVHFVHLAGVVVTTDPKTLPEPSTWYLVTNLPVKNKPRATRGPRTGASLAKVVRLYGLRNRVQQAYKQVKPTLGWLEYQVRSSRAILRHLVLVYCAFTFWWCQASQPTGTAPPSGDLALPLQRDEAGRQNRGKTSSTPDRFSV